MESNSNSTTMYNIQTTFQLWNFSSSTSTSGFAVTALQGLASATLSFLHAVKRCCLGVARQGMPSKWWGLSRKDTSQLWNEKRTGRRIKMIKGWLCIRPRFSTSVRHQKFSGYQFWYLSLHIHGYSCHLLPCRHDQSTNVACCLGRSILVAQWQSDRSDPIPISICFHTSNRIWQECRCDTNNAVAIWHEIAFWTSLDFIVPYLAAPTE